ncbi:DUF4845 domain-containing protein [Methylobacillus gramineus]|uniref:DUF4845 domain-containing protein n=1 Tax=Methylobacillus gramineus TaxID=755169 RepID=UPI001CFF5C95|nr:DUF4845 domain-containing protein [Methylobacillus gramineus]MCB5184796.1 DUF4845 domain-containing protein [Methylobacillus gramineus]
MKTQRGMTFLGLVASIAVGVFVVVVAMKLAPSYIEYFSVKKAITKIARDPAFSSMTKSDMISSFQKSATIDDIRSVDSKDLVFLRDENGKTALSVEYQVVVPLFSNVSALLDFETSTDNAR